MMNDRLNHRTIDVADRKSKEATLAGDSGWILISILTLLALLGVYVSAHAVDTGFGFFGAALSAFAVFMLFRLIALMLPYRADDR